MALNVWNKFPLFYLLWFFIFPVAAAITIHIFSNDISQNISYGKACVTESDVKNSISRCQVNELKNQQSSYSAVHETVNIFCDIFQLTGQNWWNSPRNSTHQNLKVRKYVPKFCLKKNMSKHQIQPGNKHGNGLDFFQKPLCDSQNWNIIVVLLAHVKEPPTNSFRNLRKHIYYLRFSTNRHLHHSASGQFA